MEAKLLSGWMKVEVPIYGRKVEGTCKSKPDGMRWRGVTREGSIWVLRCFWCHRAVTGVCGGRYCLFVWAGRVGR